MYSAVLSKFLVAINLLWHSMKIASQLQDTVTGIFSLYFGLEYTWIRLQSELKILLNSYLRVPTDLKQTTAQYNLQFGGRGQMADTDHLLISH